MPPIYVKCLILVLALQAGGISAVPVRNTVTSHDVTIPYDATKPKGIIQIPTTFYIPSRNVIFHKVPLVIIMSGGLVPRSIYSELAKRITAHGYVVVVAEVVRPGIFPKELTAPAAAAANAFKPGTCDPDGAFPLSNFVPTLLRWIDEARDPAALAFGQVDTHRVAIFAHSLGGPATNVVTGTSQCTPKLPFCESPVPVDNASRLKGLIYFEAVTLVPKAMMYSVTSPPLVLLYANSANESKMAYAANPHKVIASIHIHSGNHFAVNNWIEYRSPKQIGPCHMGESSSDAQVNFTTTRKIHEEALSAVSSATALALDKFFNDDSSLSSWNGLRFKKILQTVPGIGEVKVRNLTQSN